MLSGTSLARPCPVTGIGFQADDEGKGLSVEVILLNGAGLNQVSNTFGNAMLASESPAGSVWSPFGISIGIQMEVTDFPEVLN